MKIFLKKSMAVVLTAIICLSCFSIVGFAASTDVLKYEINNEGNAVVSGCNTGATGVVVVPSVVTVKGTAYDVVEIKENAFENCTKITEISISEGITTIGSRAFANCLSLTDVYIPESLLVCQYTAFSGCESVTVHCYSSNYQFFTVYGFNQNLNIDIVDAEEDSITGDDSAMTNAIVDMIKRILLMILNFITNGFASNSSAT